MTAMIPTQMNEAQRAFVQAAEALGATAPAGAVPLTSLPRLSARELDDLVDVGVVREAANWSYYVFRPRRPIATTLTSTPQRPGGGQWSRGRVIRSFLFWVLIILTPVVFLQLTARR